MIKHVIMLFLFIWYQRICFLLVHFVPLTKRMWSFKHVLHCVYHLCLCNQGRDACRLVVNVPHYSLSLSFTGAGLMDMVPYNISFGFGLVLLCGQIFFSLIPCPPWLILPPAGNISYCHCLALDLWTHSRSISRTQGEVGLQWCILIVWTFYYNWNQT